MKTYAATSGIRKRSKSSTSQKAKGKAEDRKSGESYGSSLPEKPLISGVKFMTHVVRVSLLTGVAMGTRMRRSGMVGLLLLIRPAERSMFPFTQ